MNSDKEIRGLVEAYAFEFEFARPQESKTRYKGAGTFIDIWNSHKKGTTLGIYNPQAGRMWFRRNLTMLDLENELVYVKSLDYDEGR